MVPMSYRVTQNFWENKFEYRVRVPVDSIMHYKTVKCCLTYNNLLALTLQISNWEAGQIQKVLWNVLVSSTPNCVERDLLSLHTRSSRNGKQFMFGADRLRKKFFLCSNAFLPLENDDSCIGLIPAQQNRLVLSPSPGCKMILIFLELFWLHL